MINDSHHHPEFGGFRRGAEWAPSEIEEEILAVLRGEDVDEMTVGEISHETGHSVQTLNHYIHRLLAAGWIYKPSDHTYRFRIDPRDLTDAEIAQLYREYADQIDPETSE